MRHFSSGEKRLRRQCEADLWAGGRADVAEFAVGAVWFAGRTAASAVENEPVAEKGPRVAGKEFDKVLLDADGVGECREAEALGEATDMGVDDDAFVFVEGISKDDIGGLASGSGEGGEGFER